MAACRMCSHDKGAHEHYRSGSDCSACECTRFRRGYAVFSWHRRDLEDPGTHRRRKVAKAA